MYSTSGTLSPNVINYALHYGGSLSVGFVANARMNEAKSSEDAAAQVAPNVINDALPSGVILSRCF